MTRINTTLTRFSRPTFSYAAGVIAAVVGVLVLIGWQFDVAILKAFQPGRVVMKANSGAAFFLAGLALIVLQSSRPVAQWFVRFFSLAIVLVALLTLCEYLFERNLGIDEMIFREPGVLIATSHAGRMAPHTAFNFVLIGFTLFALTTQRFHGRFFVEFPLVFSFIISALGLIGHLTGFLELTGPGTYTQIAVNTAAVFIVLCIGIITYASSRQRVLITIEQKLFIGLTAAAAIVLYISLLSLSSIQSLLHANISVEQTQHVKNQLQLVLSHVLEVQSGDRGFLLAGDDKYLLSHKEASRELPTIMNGLRLQIADNPHQQQNLVSLSRMVEERVAFSNQVIVIREKHGEARARLLFETGRGKSLTDSVRVLIAKMIAEEDRLLKTRDIEQTHQVERSQVVIYVSLGVQVILLAFIFVVVNKDVTGRTKAEEQLQRLNEGLEDRVKQRTSELTASERKYRDLADTALVGIYRSTLKGEILYVNDTMARITGFDSPEAMIRNGAFARWSDPKLRQAFIERLQRDGKVEAFENAVLTANGEPIHTLVSARINGDELIGTVLDITERKRAEESLRESENRYRSLFENMLDGYAYCKMLFERDTPQDFVYIAVNNAFEKLTGLKNVVGRRVTEVIPGIKESNPELFEIYGRVSLTGKPERFETYVEPLGIWFSISVYCPEKGHFVAVFDNITERKQSEEGLRNAEKRYRTTLDHMMEGCQIIGNDWRYLYLNDVAAKQGRRPREEILGRTMMEMYPGIDSSELFVHLRRCMDQRIPNRLENEFTFPDGSKGWFRLSIEPVPEGAFILSEDISKEKELSEELKKHQEHLEELVKERTVQLEAANKELEAFSYSVSHDLRSPLRAIDGFSRLLIEQHSSQLDHEGQRFLKIIVDSTAKMGQLIDDLLAFSRLGRQEMRKWSVDMTNLAQTVVEEAKKAEPGRTIEVMIHALNHANCDGTMIRQVFLNLISNAFKFTRRQASPRVEIGSYPEGRDTVYFVKDNGAGFDMQYVKKLFGVFQSLHRQDEYEGTGVGLGIVQRVVHRHKGRVWAEGKVNEGAKFYFTLPMEGEQSS